MPIIRLTDPADDRIADYRNLSDAELLRRGGLFIAENRLVVRELLAAPRFRTRSILLTDAALSNMEDVVSPVAETLPVFVCPTALMLPISGYNLHRGCLAVGERPPAVAVTDWLRDHPQARRLVVAEGVTNADNMGGVFRTARAFGIDAVVLGPGCCDPLYRKSIRVSIGAALQVPFAHAERWPADLDAITQAGYRVIALTPAPGAVDLEQVVLAGRLDRVALVVGNEGTGLSDAAMRRCGLHVRIPMAEGIDSLNLTTATAIALYRLCRSPGIAAADS